MGVKVKPLQYAMNNNFASKSVTLSHREFKNLTIACREFLTAPGAVRTKKILPSTGDEVFMSTQIVGVGYFSLECTSKYPGIWVRGERTDDTSKPKYVNWARIRGSDNAVEAFLNNAFGDTLSEEVEIDF